MQTILSKLRDVEDKRGKKGRMYKLHSVLGLLMLSRLRGNNTIKSAYRLGLLFSQEMLHRLDFTRGLPSYESLTIILKTVDPISLEMALSNISHNPDHIWSHKYQ